MTTWSGYVTRTTVEKVFVEVEADNWEQAHALAIAAATFVDSNWEETDCRYDIDVEEE